MSESGSSSHGFVDSVRQLGHSLVSSLHDRIELFTIELQEEKLRVIEILILINAVIFSAILALILLTLTIVYLVPAAFRVWALGGFTALYALFGISMAFVLRAKLAKMATPFEDTRGQLAADRDALKGQ